MSAERCTHVVYDQAQWTKRECGGKAVARESGGPRCKRHTAPAIEAKRRKVEAKVAAKVAGVLERTKDITHPEPAP